MKIRYHIIVKDEDKDEVIFESVYPRSEMRLDNHEEYIEEEYRKREAAINKYAEELEGELEEDDPADEDTFDGPKVNDEDPLHYNNIRGD